MCTKCSSTYYLTPNGTCLSSCNPPLSSYDVLGDPHCKGPCADEVTTIYYYPIEQSCLSSCALPIVREVESIYQSCHSCPSNCLECSSVTMCTKCSSTNYLTPNGTCLSVCNPPLHHSKKCKYATLIAGHISHFGLTHTRSAGR